MGKSTICAPFKAVQDADSQRSHGQICQQAILDSQIEQFLHNLKGECRQTSRDLSTYAASMSLRHLHRQTIPNNRLFDHYVHTIREQAPNHDMKFRGGALKFTKTSSLYNTRLIRYTSLVPLGNNLTNQLVQCQNMHVCAPVVTPCLPTA